LDVPSRYVPIRDPDGAVETWSVVEDLNRDGKPVPVSVDAPKSRKHVKLNIRPNVYAGYQSGEKKQECETRPHDAGFTNVISKQYDGFSMSIDMSTL